MPSPRQRRARRMLKRPIWQIELHGIFLENAEVHHQETGPEMSVEVCYVHHTRLPICRAPRPVRLDNIQDLWYADLCNAWFDQIQRQQPLRVHIVKPSPAYQTRPQAVIHILLSGQVVAAGGGPPCETFTVARQYDGGPRPLRSSQHPWASPVLPCASMTGCYASFWMS